MALYAVLRRENKKREGLTVNEEERDRMAFMDLTDKEVIFRCMRRYIFALTPCRTLTSDMCYR